MLVYTHIKQTISKSTKQTSKQVREMVVLVVMWAIISPTHLNSTYQNPKQAILRLCDGGFICDWCRNLKCISTSTVWAVYRYTKRLFSSLLFLYSYTSYNLIPLLFCFIFCLFLVLFVFLPCFVMVFCFVLFSFVSKTFFCTFVLLCCFWCLFFVFFLFFCLFV